MHAFQSTCSYLISIPINHFYLRLYQVTLGETKQTPQRAGYLLTYLYLIQHLMNKYCILRQCSQGLQVEATCDDNTTLEPG